MELNESSDIHQAHLQIIEMIASTTNDKRALKMFSRAEKKLSEFQYNPAISLYKECVKSLMSALGESPDCELLYNTAFIIATIPEIFFLDENIRQAMFPFINWFYLLALKLVEEFDYQTLSAYGICTIGTWNVQVSYGYNRRPEQEVFARKAISIFKPLLNSPDSERARYHLANAIGSLAEAQFIQGKMKTAGETINSVPDIIEELDQQSKNTMLSMIESLNNRIYKMTVLSGNEVKDYHHPKPNAEFWMKLAMGGPSPLL